MPNVPLGEYYLRFYKATVPYGAYEQSDDTVTIIQRERPVIELISPVTNAILKTGQAMKLQFKFDPVRIEELEFHRFSIDLRWWPAESKFEPGINLFSSINPISKIKNNLNIADVELVPGRYMITISYMTSSESDFGGMSFSANVYESLPQVITITE